MAANAYKLRLRHHYTDESGNKLSTIPSSNQLSADDVVGNKLTWDGFDADKSMTVQAPVPAVENATHIRFEDAKSTEDGEDTSRLQLVIGKLEPEHELALDVLVNADLTAEDRMQGLDKMLIPIGTRIAFKQLV